MKIHTGQSTSKEMDLGTQCAQMERHSTLKAENMSVRINMEGPKKSMSANRAKGAYTKVNAVQRHPATERFT